MKRSLLIILVALCLSLSIPIGVSAVTFDSTATLDNKDAAWARISDARLGTLNYNSTGPTFNFSFTATGLEVSTAYSLIYYADPYPGSNPGALLGVGTSDASGNISIIGSPELNMHLPTPPDTNMTVSHAGPPDNYVHPYGAKIWLVPSALYNSTTKQLTSWTPTRFLFETDLITYTDTNVPGTGVALTTTITAIVPTIGLGVSPVSVNYGSVAQNADSSEQPITLTNTGNVPIKVTASTSAGYYADCLFVKPPAGIYALANGWVSPTIPVSGNIIVLTKVHPTTAYSGTLTGSMSFIASFAP